VLTAPAVPYRDLVAPFVLAGVGMPSSFVDGLTVATRVGAGVVALWALSSMAIPGRRRVAPQSRRASPEVAEPQRVKVG
jgi:hypothetical protein